VRLVIASGGSRRPGTKSLWLLPSGPDQVGDSAVRRLPRGHMGEDVRARKLAFAFIHGSRWQADAIAVTPRE
jgi:hypothetical protein